LSHHLLTEAVNRTVSTQGHQPHLAALAGLKAHRGTCANIKPHAARSRHAPSRMPKVMRAPFGAL